MIIKFFFPYRKKNPVHFPYISWTVSDSRTIPAFHDNWTPWVNIKQLHANCNAMGIIIRCGFKSVEMSIFRDKSVSKGRKLFENFHVSGLQEEIASDQFSVILNYNKTLIADSYFLCEDTQVHNILFHFFFSFEIR